MAPHLRLIRTVPELESHDSADLTGFLIALTALSERYGIAIGDGVELYELEPDDRLSSYHADTEGRLIRA
jgi:hypothetical protein